ncbi:glycosyltransferase family 4 protein [Candidatus Omnitrophota bacterium]
MKILLLTTHLNAGGITSYLKLLARGFIARGLDVSIASSGGDSEALFSALGVKLITIDIKTKSELSIKVFKAYRQLSKIIAEENFDVIHGQTRVTQALAYWLKKKTKVPVIATCHGFFNPRWHRKLFPHWGDRVIAISDSVVGHLTHDLAVDPEAIALVKSGIELDAFPFVDQTIRQEHRLKQGLNPDAPVIGIVARLSDVKGQDILIRAMAHIVKELPSVQCCLFGQGKLEPMLRELVLTLDLSQNIIFSNVVNRVYECLSVLDVFVMPSRQEGLGISVMEAQAAGVPVVASNVGGLPSLIENEKTGLLVVPEKPKELAAAIIKFLKNKELAQACRANARTFVEENCSSEIMVDQTLEVYNGLVSI